LQQKSSSNARRIAPDESRRMTPLALPSLSLSNNACDHRRGEANRDLRNRPVASVGVRRCPRLLICAVGPVSTPPAGELSEVAGGPAASVVIKCQRRRSVTRRAARRAERGALDRRRAGAIGGCVRAGAHAYLGPRPFCWLGRRHDGDGVSFPLGKRGAAARSLRAVHADVAAAVCRELAAVHRLKRRRARTSGLMRARAPDRRVLAGCGSCV
jgi:hypothetical protein